MICPSFAIRFRRPSKGRAQGRPGARCTRDLMCKTQIAKNALEHTGSAEAVRPSLRNGFTAYSVLSPARPGLFVTVIPKKRELPRNLTPAIGASGPHDFAVRIARPRRLATPGKSGIASGGACGFDRPKSCATLDWNTMHSGVNPQTLSGRLLSCAQRTQLGDGPVSEKVWSN
jgi:hypothetical protein